MKLRRQLFFVSLLLLSLPWAGCQYIRELDATLAFAQEQAMTATAQAVAAVIAQDADELYPFGRLRAADGNIEQQLFLQPLQQVIAIDGYGDDWLELPFKTLAAATAADDGEFSVRYKSGIRGRQLMLFIDVRDDDVRYHNPTLPRAINGDRLELSIGANNPITDYDSDQPTPQRIVLNSSAPGAINAQRINRQGQTKRQPQIRAHWQETGDGYSIELSLPLSSTAGRLGFSVIDDRSPIIGEVEDGFAGRVTPAAVERRLSHFDSLQPPWFIYPPPSLQQRLAIFSQPGLRLKVVDRDHWLLASEGTVESPKAEGEQGNWLLRKLYRHILSARYSDYPAYPDSAELERERYHRRQEVIGGGSRWYADPDNRNRSILATAAAVNISDTDGETGIATVVAEQTSDRFAALSDEAFGRLFLFSLAALGFTGLGLLGYASWLSWRVNRLSRAASQVLDNEGGGIQRKLERLEQHFPVSRAADELGQLNRNYAELLTRIRDYNHYLQTLSRKLSHELRTPLAIIHSSLDNLEHCQLEERAGSYQQRAKEGASRLGSIITAMSEASRVEESIEGAEPETIDLRELLAAIAGAYDDVHSHCQINYLEKITEGCSTEIEVVPELLVQMMDKLVDNAADFCPEGGGITIELETDRENIYIRVDNDGPALPESMQSQLFGNMVSLREGGDNSGHLGLGLYIVQLIVAFHDGTVIASNREDGSGVCFEVTLPVI